MRGGFQRPVRFVGAVLAPPYVHSRIRGGCSKQHPYTTVMPLWSQLNAGTAVRESVNTFGEFETRSAGETLELGARLGAALNPGVVVLLFGELGAGKTVFAKGIASALGINADAVTSASFTLMNVYDGKTCMIHLDLYRVEALAQAEQVGLLDVFDSGAIVVVEWAEKIAAVCEKMPHIKVVIDVPGPGSRLIRIFEHG